MQRKIITLLILYLFCHSVIFCQSFGEIQQNPVLDSLHKEIIKNTLENESSTEPTQSIELLKSHLFIPLLPYVEIINSIPDLYLYILIFLLILISIIGWSYYKNQYDYSKLLEQNLMQKSWDLKQQEKEFIEASKAFIQTKKELKEELERFVYIASHDLKEPLRNIISFIQLTKRQQLIENKTGLEYFDFIEKNARQVNNLVTDVLEFSNFKNHSPQMDEVILENVFLKTKEALSVQIEEKNATISCHFFPEKIISNASLLFLIFKHLIENGIKYNESKKPVVNIFYETSTHHHVFKIIDNGIGIEPVYHQKIFKMFTRLHNRSEYEGSGLGLAVCQKIINSLNGSITLQSKLGKGTSLIVHLPKI